MQNYLFFCPLEGCVPQEEPTANAGSWEQEENLSYALFVDMHKKSMTSKKKMRQMQFYEKLSAFIGTRTSSQCRSHHQKMFDKFKYISKIVETFKIQVGVPQYKLKFQEGIQKMKEINNRFANPQNPRSSIESPSEPATTQAQIAQTYFIATAMPQLPLLYNNFYVYGADLQPGTPEPLQNYYVFPEC